MIHAEKTIPAKKDVNISNENAGIVNVNIIMNTISIPGTPTNRITDSGILLVELSAWL